MHLCKGSNCVYMYVCMNVCVLCDYECIYVRVCVCVYVYLQTCKYTFIITNGTGVPDGKPWQPTT